MPGLDRGRSDADEVAGVEVKSGAARFKREPLETNGTCDGERLVVEAGAVGVNDELDVAGCVENRDKVVKNRWLKAWHAARPSGCGGGMIEKRSFELRRGPPAGAKGLDAPFVGLVGGIGPSARDKETARTGPAHDGEAGEVRGIRMAGAAVHEATDRERVGPEVLG